MSVALLCAVCLLICAGSLGCATKRYSAANLPDELQAPRVANAQILDLSHLAMPAASDEFIAPGDVLEVGISSGLDEPARWLVRIDSGGFAALPVIGNVSLAGSTMEATESRIKALCVHGGFYRSPYVTVTRRQQKKNQVMILGAVENPGRYELPRRNSDLVSALVTAGGLSENAGTDVEIRYPAGTAHDGPQPIPTAGTTSRGLEQTRHPSPHEAQARPRSQRVNLASAVESNSKGYFLEDGAVVMVEKRDPLPIKVMGLVNKPGIYELPVGKEMRVLDAIAQAEGVSISLANKVYIIRRLPGAKEPKLIQVSLAAAKTDGRSDLRLAPGDVVSVEQTMGTMVIEALKIIRFAIGASVGTIF